MKFKDFITEDKKRAMDYIDDISRVGFKPKKIKKLRKSVELWFKNNTQAVSAYDELEDIIDKSRFSLTNLEDIIDDDLDYITITQK